MDDQRLSFEKRALLKIKALQREIHELKQGTEEPVAIVGIGCRYPHNVTTAQQFWQLLCDGINTGREIPGDLWNVDDYYHPQAGTPGKMNTRRGSFIENADGFDAEFFSVSPREAMWMDPQQRILLETAWWALENAGIVPAALNGSKTGVYIGLMMTDYAGLILRQRPEEIDRFAITGVATSVIAGRISYALGLQGPSYTLDTACSSSLTAIHMACQSLRLGECDYALAGGVNLQLQPLPTVLESLNSMLSPDGVCHTFDNDANGYARGDGCGVLVLQRLSDALKSNRNVLAVIRGSATNHDGASGGLTVPCGPSQESLYRDALANAGLSPEDISYIEAHGTGTPLGDPIELQSLENCYVKGVRRALPLKVGSVKTNFGHTEAAAGVTAVIKVALALRHRYLPAHLHFNHPHDWFMRANSALAVTSAATTWESRDGMLRAGVSGFGLNGSNAHLIVEQAPEPAVEPGGQQEGDAPFLFALSARNPAALQAQVNAYRAEIALHHDWCRADISATSLLGRTHFAHRLALIADSRAQLLQQLSTTDELPQESGACENPPALVLGDIPAADFPRDHGALGDALAACATVLATLPDAGAQTLWQDEHHQALRRFVMQFCLARLWLPFIGTPSAYVVQREDTPCAAVLSGAITLEQGLRLAAACDIGDPRERDAVLDDILSALTPRPADAAIFSVTTGSPVNDRLTSADGWRTLLDTANTAPDGWQYAAAQIKEACLIAGTVAPEFTAAAETRGVCCVSALDPHFLAGHMPLASLARLHCRGVPLNFQPLFTRPCRMLPLPGYPFQRQSYWIDTTDPGRGDDDALDDWIHEWQWTEADTAWQMPSNPGRWLVFTDVSGAGDRLAEALTARGAHCLRIAGAHQPDAHHADYVLDACDAAACDALLQREAVRDAQGVIIAWPAAAPADGDDVSPLLRPLQAVFHLTQALLRLDTPPQRLVILTRDACATQTEAHDGACLSAAPLVGYSRVLRNERPGLNVLLLDAGDAPENATALMASACLSAPQHELAWRDGRVLTPVFVARPVSAAEQDSGAENPVRADASYLITGGYGLLGRHFARWLVERGARHLLLLGRHAPPSGEFDDYRARGVTVTCLEGDIADYAWLSGVLASEALSAPLGGVIHAAGVLHDGLILNQRWETFTSVMHPKVAGAWNLHRLTCERSLDFFVLFSSAAAAFGNPGQSNYAAANAFLESLARLRRAQGLAATAIGWGAWEGIGMIRSEQAQDSLEREGVERLSARRGVAVLEWMLRQNREYAGAIRFRRRPEAEANAQASAPADNAALTPLAARLRQAAQAERLPLLIDEVKKHVASALRIKPEAFAQDNQRALNDLGLDSLTAVEIRNQLAKASGVDLPAGLLFERKSVQALAEYLLGAMAQESVADVAAAPAAQDAGPADDAIAVIGMACRFPGGALSAEQYWECLMSGQDAIVDCQPRWEATGQAASRQDDEPAGWDKAGLIGDISHFDYAFFNISEREARCMDPQQRILLETAWEALERSGYAGDAADRSRAGIFVGSAPNRYGELWQEQGGTPDPYLSSGSAPSINAGRLAYFLGWKGPALMLDTACSSSLVAIHMAAQSLLRGETSLALAGSVSLILSRIGSVMLGRMGMLSPTGCCHAFDERADGYVRAEGCGFLVLKRLSQAQRDGDNVLAVIKGSAVNQDGDSQGLTAPDGLAQEAVLRGALAQAQLSAQQVDYVETHGTGTELGDPIEIAALARVYGAGRQPEKPLRIGSVKTNVGHLETSAGIAGVMKVILALQHDVIPPHLHAQRPSAHIPWRDLPLALTTAPTPWPRTATPRSAGVSSFGFSGTNAHLILQEAPAALPRPQQADRQAHVLALSAPEPQALNDLVACFREYIAQHLHQDTGLTLADLCFSANTGRRHFGRRVSLTAASLAELQARLAEFDAQAQQQAPEAGKQAWLFGEFTQEAWHGAQALYHTHAGFRGYAEEIAALGRQQGDDEALSLPWTEDDGAAWTPARSRRAAFALGYALGRVLQGWGLRPDMILGYGAGEYTAACLNGTLDPAQAYRRIAAPGDDGAPAPADIAAALCGQGITHVLYAGATPDNAPDAALWLPLAAARENAWRTLLGALGALYQAGFPIDWRAVDDGYPRRRLALPTYPFRARRCWFTPRKNAPAASPGERSHPLHGHAFRLAGEEHCAGGYQGRIDCRALPWLADHVVYGAVIVPGAAWMEMALNAAARQEHEGNRRVRQLEILQPLTIGADEPPEVQTLITRGEGDRWRCAIYSLTASGSVLHAQGELSVSTGALTGFPPLPGWDTFSRETPAGDFYRHTVERGYLFGPAFRNLRRLAGSADQALGEIEWSPQDDGEPGYVIHPALLDGCLQVIGGLVTPDPAPDRSYMPVYVQDIEMVARVPDRLLCYVRLSQEAGAEARTTLLTADLWLYDLHGRPAGRLQGLRMAVAEDKTIRHALAMSDAGSAGCEDMLYRVGWRVRPAPSDTAALRCFPEPGLLHRCAGTAVDKGYRQALAAAESLAAPAILDALARLGMPLKTGAPLSAALIHRQVPGILAQYAPVLERFITLLTESGFIRDGALSAQPESGWDLHAGLASLDDGVHELAGPVALYRRSLLALPQILTGEQDVLTVLFPDGDTQDACAANSDTPEAKGANAQLAAIVRQLTTSFGQERTLRIVEIGAGTGATTASVLPVLTSGDSEYLFTDISPLFVHQARETFRAYPNLDYRVLDIEQEPAAQGLTPGCYDVVIAANVLHATADIAATLARVRSLLAPGGYLLLSEMTRSGAVVDLTFGLTGGWWRFSDHELRRGSPLLSADAWRQALSTGGFGETETFSASPGTAQVVLAARNASDALPAGEDPAAQSLDECCQEAIRQTEPLDRSTRQSSYEMIEALSARALAQAIAQSGFPLTPGRRFTFADLENTLTLLPAYRQNLPRWLTILEECHIVCREGEGWRVTAALDAGDVCAGLDDLKARAPVYGALINMLRGCVTQLGGVLRGEVNILDVLFPGGDTSLAAAMYRDLPDVRYYNQCIGRMLRNRLDAHTLTRPLRVLEIGGGTGGTTSQVLPFLSSQDNVEYVFTDLATLFLQRAEQQFSAWPFMQYRLFDVGRSPEEQGMAPESFDIVIAANVIHATEDLSRSLACVHRCLAPGGIAMLYEMTLPRAWLDITFGLTEGWWLFTDRSLRRDSPLITVEQWRQLAEKTGFDDFVSMEHDATLGNSVLAMSKAPQRQQPVWLIFAEEDDDLSALVRDGIRLIRVGCGAAFRAQGEDGYLLDPTSYPDYQQLAASLAGQTISHTLWLWRDGDGVYPDADCRRLLWLAQTVLMTPAVRAGIVWIVTRAAQQVVAQDDVAGFRQAALWGFSRALRRELDIDCRLLDLAPERHLGDVACEIGGACLAPDGSRPEREVALRASGRYVPRLCAAKPALPGVTTFSNAASYLITGGLGGVGLLVARWMAENGAGSLILLGRQGEKSADPQALAALRRLPVQLTIVAADVSDSQALDEVIARCRREELPPLRGVIHAAGVLHDARIGGQTWQSFSSVLPAKVAGAWHLHTLTRDLPLDFMVFFSAMGAVLGTPGQSNHAAANAWLDALAAWRRAQGLPGVSIDWGVWEQAGAAVRRGMIAHFEQRGIRPIGTRQGLAALACALGGDDAQLMVSPVDWQERERVSQFIGAERTRLFDELLGVSDGDAGVTPSAAAADDAPAGAAPLRALLEALPAPERYPALLQHMRAEIAAILAQPAPDAIGERDKLFDLGLDSLLAVNLRHRLAQQTGCELRSTLLFDYPSLDVLTRHILDAMALAAPQEATAAPLAADITGLDDMDIDQLTELLSRQLKELDDACD